MYHCRNIQEDFESLYEGGSDLHWQQQPPTSGEEWSISIPHDGEHNLHVEIIEGDFLREFDQLFQSFFRGFPMDFTPPLQGFRMHSLCSMFCCCCCCCCCVCVCVCVCVCMCVCVVRYIPNACEMG